MRKPQPCCVFSLCVLFIMSCAAKKLAVIDLPKANECLRPVESGNIVLCAEIVSEAEDVEAYYGIDLIDKGFLPVKVSLINKNDDIYIISKDSVFLKYGDTRIQSSGPGEVAEALKASVGGRTAGWGIAFGVIGGSVAYTQARNRNEALNLALHTKPLFFGQIPKGCERTGMLYFKIDKELKKRFRPKTSDLPVLILMTDLKSKVEDRAVSVDVPLN
jgi:hypothetical protein